MKQAPDPTMVFLATAKRAADEYQKAVDEVVAALLARPHSKQTLAHAALLRSHLMRINARVDRDLDEMMSKLLTTDETTRQIGMQPNPCQSDTSTEEGK